MQQLRFTRQKPFSRKNLLVPAWLNYTSVCLTDVAARMGMRLSDFYQKAAIRRNEILGPEPGYYEDSFTDAELFHLEKIRTDLIAYLQDAGPYDPRTDLYKGYIFEPGLRERLRSLRLARRGRGGAGADADALRHEAD